MKFSCAECGKTFGCRGKLNQHSRLHSGERPFVCTYPGCEKDFARADNLRRHEMGHSPEAERPLGCSYEGCDKRFVTKTKLIRHEKLHEKPKPYQCRFCDETFAKRSSLKAHESKHTGRLPHPCPVEGCSEGFRYPDQLRRHQERRHPVEPRFTCDQDGCTEKFLYFNELVKHRRDAHPTVLRPCPTCGKKFVQQKTLEDHMKKHELHPADKPRFPCTICGRTLSKMSNLRTHIRTVHEKRRSFPCPVCSRPFQFKHTMERHVRNVHSQLPAATCPGDELSVGVAASIAQVDGGNEGPKDDTGKQPVCEESAVRHSSFDSILINLAGRISLPA